MANWKLNHDGLSVSVWRQDKVPCRGLIVISHGSGGSMLDHRGTAKRLSREGWVVCAPLHEGDNFKDKSKLGTDAYWFDRPREITRTLDAVLASPRLAGMIGSRPIGAIGFSAGGYSVLAAAGGQPDLSALRRHCEEPSRDPRFCSLGDEGRRSPRKESLQSSVIRDDRLQALVLVAPVGAVFSKGSLNGVTSNVLLVRAGKDQILFTPYHAENIHHLLKSDHIYETVDDMHHFGFIEPFPWYLKPFGFEAAKDPKSYQRRKNLDMLNDKIAGFLAQQPNQPS